MSPPGLAGAGTDDNGRVRTATITITGRVQGVGFRYALRAEAQRLGTRGWVRNLRGGAVEAFVAGEPDAVDGLEENVSDGIPAGFDIRETV